MPAFIKTESCRLYFSLSDLNSFSNISAVQVAVRKQNTNKSALNADSYPTGIISYSTRNTKRAASNFLVKKDE
jgi:hypothetical protein